MTELIRSQLLIMGVMIYCGLAAGLINEVFFLFRRRFAKKKWMDGILQIFGCVLIGVLIGKFLYYCNWGKITFAEIVCFLIGLWLWRKYLCVIINPTD